MDRVLLARRTRKRFDGRPVARGVVEGLLRLAIAAPQHRLANPWRFAVLERGAIDRLAAWLPRQERIASEPDPAKGPAKIRKLVEHYLPQIGAIVQVTWRRSADPVVDHEDALATAAAVQNLLIGAEARGLAAFWSSSPAMRHPETLRWCGCDPEGEGFVASVWLGGRVDDPPAPPRRPLEEVARWLDDEHAAP